MLPKFTPPRTLSALLGGPLLALLFGCANVDIPPGFIESVAAQDPATFTCCENPERLYPESFVDPALKLSVALGPRVTRVAYDSENGKDYPGMLTGKPDAAEVVAAQIRPLDLLVVSHKSYAFDRVLPGWFSHVYIYMGTEADLRAMGLWNDPSVVPYHEQIRAGQRFLSGVAPTARLDTIGRVMQVDSVAILRPALGAGGRRAAAKAGFERIGTPYDYTFGIDDPKRLVCTGMVDATMPSLHLTRREAYGINIILPDDLAAQAIRGNRLRVIDYVVGTATGFAERGIHSLMADIALRWLDPPG